MLFWVKKKKNLLVSSGKKTKTFWCITSRVRFWRLNLTSVLIPVFFVCFAELTDWFSQQLICRNFHQVFFSYVHICMITLQLGVLWAIFFFKYFWLTSLGHIRVCKWEIWNAQTSHMGLFLILLKSKQFCLHSHMMWM